MAIDPRTFSPMVVADTCSVWNLLSSRKLFLLALSARISFFITPMVLFECIYKPRKTTTEEQKELIRRFNSALKNKSFINETCDLDDLIAVSRSAPVGLSSGELSCIAIAYKMRTIAIMTDEKKARHYAEHTLQLRVETTPKLYGWLHYHRHLSDGDHLDVIREHEKYERRPLTVFFNIAYEAALQFRMTVSNQ